MTAATSPAEAESPFPSPTIRPILASGSDRVSLARRYGRWIQNKQEGLQNSLHDGVGYLELANGGDFAANVFNEIPVPIFAIPLMAIGGAVALILPYFAVIDSHRSWKNFQVLRRERKRILQQSKHPEEKVRNQEHDVRICLDLNFKETGVEVVDRLVMDMLLGVGGILVGVGTLMAIGGANPTVYLVSNLLSGYVGNSFAAFSGLVIPAWAIFVWVRAHRHNLSGRRELSDETIRCKLRQRTQCVKHHAVIHGLTCLVAGVASLLTATMWWGYIILAPCIVASIWCNYYFKRRIGYDRPTFSFIPDIDEHAIIEELKICHTKSKESQPGESEAAVKPQLDTLPAAMEHIVNNNLFDDYIKMMKKNSKLMALFSGTPKPKSFVIRSTDILEIEECHFPALLELAHECIRKIGPRQREYRERYLLDLLGNSLHYEARRSAAERGERRLSIRRPRGLSTQSRQSRPSKELPPQRSE